MYFYLLSVCAFKSPGLQALGCHWLLRPPMAPSSVLNWPPTPRARAQLCFLRTWAGTVPGCCLRRSTGYVYPQPLWVLRDEQSGKNSLVSSFLLFFRDISQGVNLCIYALNDLALTGSVELVSRNPASLVWDTEQVHFNGAEERSATDS